MNKTITKIWMPKFVDYILRKGFCNKHMREFIQKNKIKKGFNVIQLLGICSKCHKGGIVYYLEINEKKNKSF